MDVGAVFKALSLETLEDIKDELEDIVGNQPEEGGSTDLQEALASVSSIINEKEKASQKAQEEEEEETE